MTSASDTKKPSAFGRLAAIVLFVAGVAWFITAVRVPTEPLVATSGSAPLASPPADPAGSRAIAAVGRLMASNDLGVTASELRSKDNPRGEGILVYHPKTSFQGVTRNLIWLVLDGSPYPLNGPSKSLTPTQPWPRDAGPQWAATGLDQDMATDAIGIVFGPQ